MVKEMKIKLHREVHGGIIDHLFTKIEKDSIFSYPYPVGSEEIKGLIKFCDENKLEFIIRYYPGHTIEIEIFEKGKYHKNNDELIPLSMAMKGGRA
jgi:hypothetical protein